VIKSVIAFKKAIAKLGFKKARADIAFKKAIVQIKTGNFLIFRFFFDALGLSDTEAKNVGKSLSDSQGMTDNTFNATNKIKSDSVSLTEQTLNNVNKAKQDGAAFSDTHVKAYGKNSQEAISLIDIHSFASTKGLGNTSQTTDAVALSPAKSLSDQSALTDSESKAIAKALSESAAFADQIAISQGHVRSFSNSALWSDDHRMDFHKFISEGLFATDDLDGEATAQDDQEMSFVKVRTDLAVLSDNLVTTQGKSNSDTIGSTDSGSLRGQGYAEFGYFLEDYVGYSRTF